MSEAYRQAGVHIEAGYEAVDRMKSHVERTKRKGVVGALGGFGGLFDLSQLNYEEPVLVSGTDGVGTKLKLAFMTDQHDTIGVDAVAMCVNDIVAQGAEPLYFLDYLALGEADPEKIEQIVKGIADGCEQSGCALIGGETAEMPGLYDPEEYDVAGFVVGAAEKRKLITGEGIKSGDILIGLPSSGIHSNGFSLVRKALLEEQDLDLNTVYPPFTSPLKDVLLTPTSIYVKQILALIEHVDVKGIAHITGGGFDENIPRMLPDHLGATIDLTTFPKPDIFTFIEEHSNVARREMYNIFNMGIGMVVAINRRDLDEALLRIKELGEEAYVIGSINETGELLLTGEAK
ncbi:phosphoribosylformylglycinamidine cyclo-ligase [Alkalibacillus haloalkaliphilus]|uniref:Phosphoribosylformylglycinamidine cyclo-ligase n=1 Tax=Alkalibacillus haloalkaliphilus TaxID=94136 RepID=A0A511W7D7_9BACI|nr:phosphoribosylformylglycinamidine cyclo-ligase [Alkalibacillus haloalkaliphilus]GEN46947.1 phosphoribosylformylglycinamidine cyclo-ligase [Alkalibacillus haloalkaliphilus]